MNTITHFTIAAAAATVATTAATAATYFEEVSADNPVSWYRFEGNLNDSGSGNNDATNNGILFSTGTGPIGSFTTNGGDSLGQFGIDGAAAFGDLGDRNATSSLLRDITGASAVTVELWIDFDSITNAGNVLFVPDQNNSAQIAVRALANGSIFFGGRSANGESFQNLGASTTGGLQHVVGVYDYADSEIRIYANGTLLADGTRLAASSTLNPLYDTAARAISIGRAADAVTTNQFAGNIDELAIYDYELDLDDIQAHYAAAVPEPTSALAIIGGVGLLGLRRRGR